ncbi:hypothetical protein B296_00025762 [Ensete ventricosum]|uniref:Uncharacterized protein n=1 Tax=Ensete ventricosum TaxID=4639 RepID=A0A427ACB8_ENSVE|nr:hypothetical protein B296_00025762 [Ensete ventricosum]
MLGIDPKVAQHHLNIEPTARPVKQRPRKFAPDRQKAIEREVARLLNAPPTSCRSALPLGPRQSSHPRWSTQPFGSSSTKMSRRSID